MNVSLGCVYPSKGFQASDPSTVHPHVSHVDASLLFLRRLCTSLSMLPGINFLSSVPNFLQLENCTEADIYSQSLEEIQKCKITCLSQRSTDIKDSTKR